MVTAAAAAAVGMRIWPDANLRKRPEGVSTDEEED
jgi:hypothetical protein